MRSGIPAAELPVPRDSRHRCWRTGKQGTSPGSVFNEPGFGSSNGGTGGNACNAAGAPSQYDVACYRVNQPHP